MNDYLSITPDVKLGANVKLSKFINLYGCEIGDNTKLGAFVEIQKNARIGKNCKISSHTFICEGVTIEDDVFVGHGVTFINDSYPRATTAGQGLQTEADWKVEPTVIKKGASIGSGATILSKITVGERAIVGTSRARAPTSRKRAASCGAACAERVTTTVLPDNGRFSYQPRSRPATSPITIVTGGPISALARRPRVVRTVT